MNLNWVIGIVVVLVIMYGLSYVNSESFFYINRDTCAGKGLYSCASDCGNCGYCYSVYGNEQCVPGDVNGPYFRKDCYRWVYRDPSTCGYRRYQYNTQPRMYGWYNGYPRRYGRYSNYTNVSPLRRRINRKVRRQVRRIKGKSQ